MYDGQDFKGRVAGTFPNFRMFVSARNPKLQRQSQPQQQTEQQENQSNSDLGNTSCWLYAHEPLLTGSSYYTWIEQRSSCTNL